MKCTTLTSIAVVLLTFALGVAARAAINLGYNPAAPFAASVDAAGNSYVVSNMTISGYGTGVFATKISPMGVVLY